MKKFEDLKLFIGPMSKNVVDSVLECDDKLIKNIAFIPSRRQIEYNGGYVNNWTTKGFKDYLDRRVCIQRDHGGPGQGTTEDDGFTSFKTDAENFDIIHVDPWKKYQDYEAGLAKTIECMKYIYEVNSDVLFEVGTEESIRKFTQQELEKFLNDLQKSLPSPVYDNIQFAVVQSGVGLDLLNRRNTGVFSLERLTKMCEITTKYGIKSKEHNGDYLSTNDIQIRFNNGLNAINIAPEFGQIETSCYLEVMTEKQKELFYKICLESSRWCKWVSLDDIQSLEQLILVCGHYVFAHKDFKLIEPNINNAVRDKMKNRIFEILKVVN